MEKGLEQTLYVRGPMKEKPQADKKEFDTTTWRWKIKQAAVIGVPAGMLGLAYGLSRLSNFIYTTYFK